MDRDPPFETLMIQAAHAVNAQCPCLVDSLTRLDNAMVLAGNIFQYAYTLDLRPDPVELRRLQESLFPRLVNQVRTTPALEPYRRHKVTMVYSYRDPDGVHLFEFHIGPDLYGSHQD